MRAEDILTGIVILVVIIGITLLIIGYKAEKKALDYFDELEKKGGKKK